MNSMVQVRMITRDDQAVLDHVAPDVFDNVVDPRLAAQFLGDERHHLAVAIAHGQVVGFASGVHYVHPDKAAELWINEVGVAPGHRRRGIGKAVVGLLLQHGRRLHCRQAWVLTEHSNQAALRLYASLGGERAPGDQVMFEFDLAGGHGAAGTEEPDLERLLENFADAWNRHDVDALMSMMTEDGVFEASGGEARCGERHEGARAVRAAYEAVFAQYPDAHWGGARHFVHGERGVSEWTFTGTLTDGRRVEVNGCDLFTFRDGRIAEKNSFRKNRAPLPPASGARR